MSGGSLLITGADGQLGRALAEEFAAEGAVALTRADWDVSLPAPASVQRATVVGTGLPAVAMPLEPNASIRWS